MPGYYLLIYMMQRNAHTLKSTTSVLSQCTPTKQVIYFYSNCVPPPTFSLLLLAIHTLLTVMHFKYIKKSTCKENSTSSYFPIYLGCNISVKEPPTEVPCNETFDHSNTLHTNHSQETYLTVAHSKIRANVCYMFSIR